MPLFLKELKKEKRSAWLFYPNMPNRSEIKVCSVTVVRPEASEESVQRLLRATGAGETSDSVFSESGRTRMESGWLSGSRYPNDRSLSGSDEPEGR